MAKPFLSVIVPNYPATENLPLTLIDVDRHLSEQEYSYEILVVNGKGAQKVGELIKNLKFLDSVDDDGTGSLVRQGMNIAKGNWRLIINPANTVSISEFNKMIPYFSENYEVIVGRPAYMFLCFSETAAMQIFPLTKTNRWAFLYEARVLAKTLKYKVKKISVVYIAKKKLAFKPLDYMRSLWEIIKIRWRLWRNKYGLKKKNIAI